MRPTLVWSFVKSIPGENTFREATAAIMADVSTEDGEACSASPSVPAPKKLRGDDATADGPVPESSLDVDNSSHGKDLPASAARKLRELGYGFNDRGELRQFDGDTLTDKKFEFEVKKGDRDFNQVPHWIRC
jgi:hypothetical protein